MAASTSTNRQQFRSLLASIADKAKATLPECNGRVESAVKLVLNDDIEYHAEDGSALVNSCTNAGRVYHVKGGVCDCQDFARAPRGFCKHRLAVAMLVRLHEALPDDAPVAAPVAPLPEAPASVNLKVLVAGHEVMVTLRDTDEATLFERLHAVLKRSDVRPLPKPQPRQQWRKRGA
jgi:hypothetical protein